MSLGRTEERVTYGPAGVVIRLRYGKLYRETQNVPAPRPGRRKQVGTQELNEMGLVVTRAMKERRIPTKHGKEETRTLYTGLQVVRAGGGCWAELSPDQLPVSNGPDRTRKKAALRRVKEARKRNRRRKKAAR